MAPLVVAAIVWAPEWVFHTVLSLAVLAAADEMVLMARAGGIRSGRVLPLILLACVLIAAAISGPMAAGLVMAASVLLLPVLRLADPHGPDGSLAGVGVETTVVLYLGLCGAAMIWLRRLPEAEGFGVQLVLFLCLAVWIGDTGAYYLGKNFGRHRMAPSVSPNKTWEGLIGGMVATAAASIGFHALWPLPLPWPELGLVTAVLALTAPAGDLIESQFKRDTGIKDSSNLIPGHGGLLDRTDSLLFAAPFVLASLWLLGTVG